MAILLVRLLRWIGLIGLSLIGLFVLSQIVQRIIRRVHPQPMPPFLAYLLHSPLRIRLFGTPEQILDRAGVTPGMHVLEVGPGSGFFTVPLAQRVAAQDKDIRLTCLEIQPEMIAQLRQHLQSNQVSNVDIIQGNGQQMPFPEKSFDMVFLVTVLGEVADLPAFIRECARVLRPGGVLAVTEQISDPDFRLPRTIRTPALNTGLTDAGYVGLPWWTYTARYYKQAR